jgi:hypothetical protein
MEASMHGSFDRSREPGKSIYRSWRIGLLPALLAMALVGLAITHPNMSSWISDTVQAEFANTYLTPEITPTQIAQPATKIRTVRAN